MSGGGFSTLAIIVASNIPLIRDMDEAYNLAKLSLEILDKFGSTKKQWLPRSYVAAYGLVFPWREPLSNCRDRLLYVYQVGMRTGDIEFGMMGATMHVFMAILSGTPLHKLEKDIADMRKAAKAYRVNLVDSFLAPVQQFVANLAGESENVFTLTGEFMNEREEMRSASLRRNRSLKLNIPMLKCWIALYMGNWELAETFNGELVGVDEAFRSTLAISAYHFQSAMIAVALLRKHGRDRRRKRKLNRSFREIQRMARNCPSNFYMLQTIVEAEQSALTGKMDDAVNRYKLAIDLAQREKALCYEAVATERLAFTLESDERRSSEALEHYIKARNVFETWGVNVKVDQLSEIISNRDGDSAQNF